MAKRRCRRCGGPSGLFVMCRWCVREYERERLVEAVRDGRTYKTDDEHRGWLPDLKSSLERVTTPELDPIPWRRMPDEDGGED